MDEKRLNEIKTREQAATPGPWGWFGNTDVHQMYLATKRYGRMYVMGFRRWGLQGAQPTFCVDRTWKPDPQSGDDFGHAGTIAPAHELASRIVRYEVAPNAANRADSRVYRADLIGIKNPDAEFIAHSRQDVADLVADLEKVHHRHRPVEKDGVNVCHECDGLREQVNPDAEPVLWPCSTVSELDGDTTTETSEEAA